MTVTSFGEGNGTPPQYSCMENPTEGGAWKAAVHGVAEGRTRLIDFTFTFHFHALEKEMATHSSVLAWRIPGTGDPGGLPSMGLHRVGHIWSDLAAAAAVTSLPNDMTGHITSLRGVGDSELRAGLETRCAGPPHSITGKTNSCDRNQWQGKQVERHTFSNLCSECCLPIHSASIWKSFTRF